MTAPADSDQRRGIIAAILNCWEPHAVRTLRIYSAAIVLDLLAPVTDPLVDYPQVPRALGLAPTITFLEDGEEVDSIDSEDWQIGVAGLHDLGRGLRPHEHTINDIPKSDTVWLLLSDEALFRRFGCTPEGFILGLPDVRSAAAEVIGASRQPDPAAVLAPYVELPPRT